jgi:alkanesulfonate monooxygenase SsuD/methylene tetrahydromethanopterin reductase-like flavin-dependent oxidoreductase (luciferase family)
MDVSLWYDFRNPRPWAKPYADLYDELLGQIVWAEGLGVYRAVWLSEHHFSDEGYLPAVLPMMAAISERTQDLRIGSQVLLAPLHHPLRLAEDVAVVDQLSRGRIDLGLAIGYRDEEFEVLGVPRSQRGSRTSETLELLRKAWTGEPFSHRGEHFSFDDVIVSPTPYERSGVPLWVGGSSHLAAQRAGSFGCAFLADAEAAPEVVDTYHDAFRAFGGDDAMRKVGSNRAIYVCDNADVGRREVEPHFRYMYDRYRAWGHGQPPPADLSSDPLPEIRYIIGTPAMVVDTLGRQHERSPFDELTFWARPAGLAIEKSNRSIELFATEVYPHLADL